MAGSARARYDAAEFPAASSPPLSKSLAKSTSVVGGMTLASRVMGFLRDMVFARFFGAAKVSCDGMRRFVGTGIALAALR
jgi:hypothetical protein